MLSIMSDPAQLRHLLSTIIVNKDVYAAVF